MFGIELSPSTRNYVEYLQDNPNGNCLYVAAGSAIRHLTDGPPPDPSGFSRRMSTSLAIAEMSGKFTRPDGVVDPWSVARDVLQSTLGEHNIFPSRYFSTPGKLPWSVRNVSHVKSRIVAPIESFTDPVDLSFNGPALVYTHRKNEGHVEFIRSSREIRGIILGDFYMRVLNERSTIEEVHLLEAKHA